MGVDSEQNASASGASTQQTTANASSSRVGGFNRIPTPVLRTGFAKSSASIFSSGDRKRKLQNDDDEGPVTHTQPTEATPPVTKKQATSAAKGKAATRETTPPHLVGAIEKRLRKFRAKPPLSFLAVYERATTQRFFVLSRTFRDTFDGPEMSLEVAGSTGNIYNVCIAQQPTCDCPHAKQGNQCKHTIFVLSKVLKAKYEYVYQLALLHCELEEIFEKTRADEYLSKDNEDQKRKPVDGDCPICFEEMQSGPGKEALVWCKAACGQNIHRECFNMWANTKGGKSKTTCPYCRSDWDMDDGSVDLAKINREDAPISEGYVNVADQLGISGHRDWSTYHNWWPRGRAPGRRSHWKRW